MTLELLPAAIRSLYEVREWKHACAILKNDFPVEWQDIIDTLTTFRFRQNWIEVGGGRKSKVSESIDSALYARGWAEKHFDTEIAIDGHRTKSPTHSVDCFKNRVALEIEWNNEFYGRPQWPGRLARGVRRNTVAMESTGVYWIPLFDLLESRGFTVQLVNARHVKNV